MEPDQADRTEASVTEAADGQAAELRALRAQVAQLQRERDEARGEVARLGQRSEYLDLLLRSNAVVLAVMDPDGRFLLTDGGALSALGVQPGQSVGRSLFDLYPEASGAHAAFRRARAGETLRTLIDFLGRRFEAWFVPMRDEGGAVLRVVSVAVDLTDRLRAEAERRMLAEAAEVLASSLDYAHTLEQVARLAVQDLADLCAVLMERGGPRQDERGVASASRRDGAERRLQVVALRHRDPALAGRMQELARGFADEAENPVLAQVMRDGRSFLGEELGAEDLRAIIADSRQLQISRDELKVQSAMAVALRGRDRALGVLVLLSCDPRRRFGPQDLALTEELARRAALAVERAQLYAAAQEAVRSREEFLSIASHELRSPLNTLSLQVQLLLRAARGPGGVAGIAEERLIAMLDSCERQLQRVTELINRLFDLSRLLSGRLDLNPEAVELCALARDVVGRFQSDEEVQRGGAALRVQGDEVVVGRWDRLRLEQVITNLLSNAVKYGEGRPILVTVERDGALARLTVTDEGIGIAPGDQSRIFERFERATSQRAPGSLGLGLYIVRHLVVLMGGSIRVRSEPGAGASFIVELPLG